MAWVTSLPVSKDNVAEIVACGRARWKIENESKRGKSPGVRDIWVRWLSAAVL